MLKIKEDVPKKPIEVDIEFEPTGTAQGELVFFDKTNQHETTEQKNWKRKEKTQHFIPTEPPAIPVF